MHGMVTIACHSAERTVTWPPSLPPQGYIASGDGYIRRYDDIVLDIHNKTKCVDDALLWADTLADSYFQAVEWLFHDIMMDLNIVLALDNAPFVLDADRRGGKVLT